MNNTLASLTTSAHVCTTSTPPPGVPGLLTAVLHPAARAQDYARSDENTMLLLAEDDFLTFYGTRHPSAWERRYLNYPGHKWHCTEYRRDADDKTWKRDFYCVTNDHGWLVEVPKC